MKKLTTKEAIKVFSDPYRLRILNCFNHFNEPKTVKEIADYLGEVPAKIHYHVKKMVSVDILRLVYTKEIKGIIAKYYEPTAESFQIENSRLNNDLTKTYRNETAKFIATLYDESKSIFIKEIEKDKEDDKTGELKGQCTMLNVKLTKEEAEEFNKFINEFAKKYKNRKESKNLHEHHLFVSFMPIKHE